MFGLGGTLIVKCAFPPLLSAAKTEELLRHAPDALLSLAYSKVGINCQANAPFIKRGSCSSPRGWGAGVS